MKDFKLVTKKNYVNVFAEIKNPYIIVKFDVEKTREKFNFLINLGNKFFVETRFKEKPYSEPVRNDDNEVVENEIEGYYFIYCTDKNSNIEFLDDEINLQEIIKKASETQKSIEINIRKELFKYAKTLCFESGCKFRVEPDRQIIDGKKPGKSIFRLMEDAFRAGDASISFDAKDVNFPTLRTYTSQLGARADKKFKPVVSGDTMTIFFKEPDNLQVFENDLKVLLRGFDNKISVPDIFRAMVKTRVTEDNSTEVVKSIFSALEELFDYTEAVMLFNDMIPQPTEKQYDLDENEEI